MNIIPKPNSDTKYVEGEYLLKPVLQVLFNGFNEYSLDAFAYRAKVKIEATQSNTDADLILQKDVGFAKEQYRLEVLPNQIKIIAAEELGIIAALTTLHLNLSERKSTCFTLDDAPRYKHRGFSLDCVRQFFEADEIKKIIEQISLVKINVFHWHLTDDQGWRIESKVFPKLHQLNNQKHYKQEEILDIVQFAKIRGVDVIPEIDFPGHTTAVIAAYPHLSCQGKPLEISMAPGGIHDIVLCAGKESTYEFVFAVLDEVCELFDSPRIHTGGDEAPKSEWENCEDCKRQLTLIKGEEMEDLQGDFTLRVAKHLQNKGKTPVFWNEVLRARQYPENIQVQFWIEPDNEKQLETYFNAGGEMIFSDMFYNYLDYPHSMSSLERVYNYQPRIGEIDCQDAPNTLGIESCMWCERVETPKQLEKQIFPRIFAMAENAWTYKKNYEDFKDRLLPYLQVLDQKKLFYTSIKDSNPTKEERIAELTQLKLFIAGYMPQETAPSEQVAFFNGLTKGFQLPLDLMGPL